MRFWPFGKKTAAIRQKSAARLQTGFKSRLGFTFVIFCCLYGAIAAKLIYYGRAGGEIAEAKAPPAPESQARPDIIDRNGLLLATDIKTWSLFAEPRRIIDIGETIDLLAGVLPQMNRHEITARLERRNGFAWVARGLSARQKAEVMALGIPGLGFQTETRRFYPGGAAAAHILGFVNIDNQGIAGMEKYIDEAGLGALRKAGLAAPAALEPVALAIDMRVQAVVHDEVAKTMARYRAEAAGAVVLKVDTGEVMAMVSMPDFNPNRPVEALQKDRLNRITAGTFEMGSSIKSFTTAMALDSGKFRLDSKVDASRPLRFGSQQIKDFHGKYRPLTVEEVFRFSSNIGSGKEAEAVGISGHRAFLKRLGLLTRMQTQLPEVAEPFSPRVWKKVNSATISFGHGFATTPMQTAIGVAALVNGGFLLPPSFLPVSKAAAEAGKQQVVAAETVRDMRYLYKRNADIGTGRRGAVDGYRVGGKTGTAEKVINGRYSKGKNFNSFIAAFPMDKPAYVVLTIVDDPKPAAGEYSTTAAFNAAPLAAGIIRRSATFLGVLPDFTAQNMPIQIADIEPARLRRR
ncbi:peptidoglycan D,D-transpeptidase FtsI family protein [Candidatus Tokpelaia sp.]|uniref:peptidoglycan D,D-transpeptidase FtsI family protein n=1 Tax=Candidatus Tokpelaia sp. TaxID=2233777 RepID=UPI00123A6D3A|nr:penicillin-binding protein 2 [Candidatus Tokpelaia sp.]KAA6405857.1 penicillin-binding protein 2 [Candidatus Tokpelaia sp.]